MSVRRYGATWFLPGEISRLLAGHWFGELTDFGAEEARAAYFGGRADVEIAGAQRLESPDTGGVV